MAMNVGTGRSGDPDVMIDINTTPLIDVMLVLLVMLIITIPIQLHAVNLNMPLGNPPPPLTPPEVVKKLNAALRPIIESPDVQAKFKNVGFEGFSSTPEELGGYMKSQLADWGKMVKDAGIQPN